MHRQPNAKRKKVEEKRAVKPAPRRENKMEWQDEEISSSEDDLQDQKAPDSDAESDDFEESAEDKRLRLAKQYLSHMKAGDADDESSDEDDSEVDNAAMVSERLKTTRMRAKGELYEDNLPLFKGIDVDNCTRQDFGGHQGPITCLAITRDEDRAFTGSKDNSILSWDLETGARMELRQRWNKDMEYQSSKGEVLAVAVTHDGKYVASGGRDGSIRIYDNRQKYAEVKELKGHRDAVTSLCFRTESYTLFSGSLDRCLKHWDINEMAYIETMFGHQDAVYSVDCWVKEKPLSTSSDRSVRLWKVAEETHLVFRGHKSSIDCVQYLTDTSFVSAGQDGALNLWKDSQKHPVRSVAAAHGQQAEGAGANWVSSVASIKMSNIVATGSNDGFVRLWNANAEERVLAPVVEVPMAGCVNALALTPRLLVAGCGREHKYGRWWTLKGSLNKLRILRFDALLEGVMSSSDNEESENGSDHGENSGDSSGEHGEDSDEVDDSTNDSD